jgi:hypothetical protein
LIINYKIYLKLGKFFNNFINILFYFKLIFFLKSCEDSIENLINLFFDLNVYVINVEDLLFKFKYIFDVYITKEYFK